MPKRLGCMCDKLIQSCPTLFATLWTVARQAPVSMEFSRQEHWSGWPCPPPGNLPDPGIASTYLMFPAWADVLFTTSNTWEVPKVGDRCPKAFRGSAALLPSWFWVSGLQNCKKTISVPIRYLCECVQLLQSCLILCNPKDCSSPGSSAKEILQARILEQVAMPSSRASSHPRIEPRSPAWQADYSPLSHRGSPIRHPHCGNV